MRSSENTQRKSIRRPLLPLFGTLLIVTAVVALLPLSRLLLYGDIVGYGRDWDRRSVQVAELAAGEVSDRLRSYEAMSMRFTSTDSVLDACDLARRLGLDQEFHAVTAAGVQLCGPALGEVSLGSYRWQVVGRLLFHSVPALDGGTVGAVVDPSILLPDRYEELGSIVELVDDNGVAFSGGPEAETSGSGPGTVSRYVTRLPGSSLRVSVTVAEPYDNRNLLIASGFALGSGLLLLAGVVLRVVLPIWHWWRRTSPPGDAQLLLVGRNGKVRAATRHRFWPGAGQPVVDRVPSTDAGGIDELLGRSLDGEAMLDVVLRSTDGGHIRVVIIGWLPVIRRHLVLVTRHFVDPLMEVFNHQGNLTHATILDPAGRVVRVANEALTLLDPVERLIGSDIVELLDQHPGGLLSRTLQNSRDSPYLIISCTIRFRWRSLGFLVFSDVAGVSYIWLSDATDALHGRTLRKLLSDLRSYLEHANADRPDVAAITRDLRPPPDLTGRASGSAQRSESMLADVAMVVRFADRERFAASGISEMKVSAGRRREYARRLHEQVVQPIAALRWVLAGQAAEEAMCEGVLRSLRAIIEEIHVPPWEQRIRTMLDDLLATARSAGIAVSLKVSVPEPIPYELMSVVALVMKESLTNSIKHARPAGLAVDLRTLSGSRLCLTVTDEAPNNASANADVSDRSGVGFGLRFCRELAEEYGGSFDLRTAPDGHVARLILKILPSSPGLDPTAPLAYVTDLAQ